MNDITFLRTCMTTVITKLTHKYNIEEIIHIIHNDKSVLIDANILAKYYKRKDGTFFIDGTPPNKVKCFPKTLTLYCKTDTSITFKIRWFYSKSVNTLHLASGLKPNVAMGYLIKLAEYFKSNTVNTNIISHQYVLANGMAQAKLGVNLFALSKLLDESYKDIVYVYTPDRSASLKLYMKNGTVCVHSTGKILYMGSKTYDELKQLHDEIATIGKSWTGVSVM